MFFSSSQIPFVVVGAAGDGFAFQDGNKSGHGLEAKI
jgi:hypothetical protein